MSRVRPRRSTDLPPAVPAPSRPLASALVRPLALALAGAGLLGGCYSNTYLDGLCANTGYCPDPPPESPVAFRITALELIDPHIYTFDTVLGVCTDSTATFNGVVAQSIDDYDVSNTLVLRPLDPKSAIAKLQYVSAFCIAGDPTNCTDRMVDPALSVDLDVFNLQSGACGGTEPNSLNPDYESPVRPEAPCLSSEKIPDATPLRLAAQPGMVPLDLALHDLQFAAAYDIDGEPQQLVSGTIRGFLPAATAMTSAGQANGIDFIPWNVLAGGAGCELDPMNAFSDIDNHPFLGQGVWMYFKFTAERVQWATDRPEPMPGTTGDDSDSDTSGTSGTSGPGTTGPGTTGSATTGGTTMATVGTTP
ncbi:MAG TPA: hypothetical protein VIK91_10305 [Nannocystis sp.]